MKKVFWENPYQTQLNTTVTAKVSCGGTHVKSTAEVGLANLKRVNIGGGKERIEIKLQEPDHANPPQNL
jgi:Ser-tRNA(Ala) deacylase AlaX